jgi:hypothetical protein
MSAWRRVALERFPKLREEIERSENVSMLWTDLYLRFFRAHEEPVDLEMIRRCYEYAWWCFNESKNPDVTDAVGMGFYENLPTDKLVRQRLAEHLTTEQFEKAAGYICHFLDPEQFNQFREEFKEQRRQVERKWGRYPK